MKLITKKRTGISLLSIVLAVGLFGIVIPSLTTAVISANRAVNDLTKEFEAYNLVMQSIHALQSIQAQSFSNLTVGTYGLSSSSGYWQLFGSSDIVDSNYTRTITITSGGSDTIDAEININWTNLNTVNRNLNHTITLTNWY